MSNSPVTRYRIGIDVGERSVGLAAVSFDDDDTPIEILSCVSHIHDGGKLPGTDKAPQSRLATAGVARRTRRLVRNRRRRLKKLDELLMMHNFPIGKNMPQTYDAWHARSGLFQNFVEDDKGRKALLSLAIRHMARHRGWKNPWWSFQQLEKAVENYPTKTFVSMRDKFAERFGVDAATIETIGQLGDLSAQTDRKVRLSTKSERNEKGPIFFERIMQEDQLFELQSILRTQKIEKDFAHEICKVVFEQVKPHVSVERIGKDSLPGMGRYHRTSRFILEFQEARIRNSVANLTIRGRGSQNKLTEEEYDKTIEMLLAWRVKEIKPSRQEISELLGLNPQQIRFPTFDQDLGSTAFRDDTSTLIEATFKKKTVLGTWWSEASFDLKADFIAYVLDRDENDGDEDLFLELIKDEETMTKLEGLDLPSGRAAYSRETYRRLLPIMRSERCGEYEAIKKVFGVDDGWQPVAPTFDDKMEHPTVDRVLTIVRRYLFAATSQWGLPEVVVIEHVRDAFIGPSALSKMKYEISNKTKKNDEIREELKSQGMEKVRKADLFRNRAIQMQGCECLYCGETINLLNSELDHIVPRSDGGSNRSENLVAVCKSCNLQKGALPFSVWAASSKKPGISIENSKERIKKWQKPGGMQNLKWFRFKSSVVNRLGLAEDDEDIDERSLASTAYAAKEVRMRVQSYLSAEAKKRNLQTPNCVVYSGTINSLARRAGGIDEMLKLRGKETKSRLDRRHHAIDAAVLTTLNQSVSQTLAQRKRLQDSDRMTGKHPEWKDFTGKGVDSQKAFNKWKIKSKLLAENLLEELRNDRIPVVRPLRIQASSGVGSAHQDTILPLVDKETRDGLSAIEVKRISNPKLLNRILDHLSEDGSLSSDLAVQKLGSTVKLFPSSAAYIQVRNGACLIGDTVHHSRVYVWKSKNGYSFGQVRVYAGEFPKIGFAKKGVDVLRQELPISSQASLTADDSLLKRIGTGEAKLIGWVTQDDEFEFDIEDLKVGEEKMAVFLQSFPEKRWTLIGLPSAVQIQLYPHYLSQEGGSSEMNETVRQIIEKKTKLLLSFNKLLNLPNCRVIRRSVIGKPRWKDVGLPYSWSPLEEAKKAFGE